MTMKPSKKLTRAHAHLALEHCNAGLQLDKANARIAELTAEVSLHTPGPWDVYYDHPMPSITPELGYIRPVYRSARHDVQPWGHHEIALAWGCEKPEQAANMRLMATAPELLAVVLLLLKGNPPDLARHEAERVVCKATGVTK